MGHPLATLPPAHRRRLFLAVLAGTFACGAVLWRLDQPLRTDAAPRGIVDLELAGGVAGAETILASWDERARVHAAMSLGLDSLFLLLYSTTLAQACLWAASRLRRSGSPLAPFGPGLAWGQWGAAALDAAENAALWRTLIGPVRSPWPELAWWCAVPKFALVGLALLYLCFGSVAIRMRPRR